MTSCYVYQKCRTVGVGSSDLAAYLHSGVIKMSLVSAQKKKNKLRLGNLLTSVNKRLDVSSEIYC